jgi:oligopeptide/dipeptide ABC transporter ATP-binding protein
MMERSANSSPLAEVRRLSVTYLSAAGNVRAVRDVSFDIEESEILALVGETGCGKSTLASALTGLLDPQRAAVSGELRLHGRALPDPADERSWRSLRGASIGMVFQDPRGSLNPVLTAGAQLTDAIRAHRALPVRGARARAASLLNRVGLEDGEFIMRRYPYELSGGMCQRIGIALALCGDPVLLVADEPTSALDPTVQAQILKLLRDMNRAGMAVLLISHDLNLVAQYASRIAVMYHGRIVELGPVRSILDSPRHPYTRGLIRANPGFAEPGRRLEAIPGAPPPFGVELAGCGFAPRCPSAHERCRVGEPHLQSRTPGHEAACFLDGEE